MKTFTKIFWGLISGVICIMYKFEAIARCELKVIASSRLGTTLDYATCSAATICARYPAIPGMTKCETRWQTENYKCCKAKFNTVDLTSQASWDEEDCPTGTWVHFCTTNAGKEYYTGVDSIYNVGGCDYTSCAPCPDGGTTLTSVGYTVYDAGRGYGEDTGYDDYIYVCSTYDAISGVQLNGAYMQVVALSCTETNSAYRFNDINDCFIPPVAEFRDTTGTYNCGEYSAWYN